MPPSPELGDCIASAKIEDGWPGFALPFARDGAPVSEKEPETIGSRVRSCRRFRGMTLETLAGLSGLSKGYLSMIEDGLRPLNNRHHVAALADALKVSVTDLTGQPYPANDRASTEVHSGLAVIRDTLVRRSLDFAEGTGARPLSVLRVEGEKIGSLTFDARYSEAVRLIPGVLDELHKRSLAELGPGALALPWHDTMVPTVLPAVEARARESDRLDPASPATGPPGPRHPWAGCCRGDSAVGSSQDLE